MLCVGGRQGKLPVPAFEVYDFETSRWRKLPDIPSKRVFALYAHSDTHIFSVGGLHQDARQGFSDVTEVFDLDAGLLLHLSQVLLVFSVFSFVALDLMHSRLCEHRPLCVTQKIIYKCCVRIKSGPLNNLL